MKPYVLIVEDADAIFGSLRGNLEREGFEVHEANTCRQALKCLEERKPDAILLDWLLRTMSGIEICQQIRLSPGYRSIPVIMVTSQAEDHRRCFDAGADDYLEKPFSMADLIARLRFATARVDPMIVPEILEYADVKLDMGEHRATRGGRAIHLGPTEFRLLRFFLQHPRRVFSRENLLDAIWGRNIEIDLRTVDVHIRRLRKAINSNAPNIIRTVRSAGYAIDIECRDTFVEERGAKPWPIPTPMAVE